MDKLIYSCHRCGKTLSYHNLLIEEGGDRVICRSCLNRMIWRRAEIEDFVHGVVGVLFTLFIIWALLQLGGCGDLARKDGEECWCVQYHCYTWLDGSERCDCLREECVSIL